MIKIGDFARLSQVSVVTLHVLHRFRPLLCYSNQAGIQWRNPKSRLKLFAHERIKVSVSFVLFDHMLIRK